MGANAFFTNPVQCIQYILAGFLYKVHKFVAMGDVGNVFDLSWLLETKAYSWIARRYVAMVTIVVAFLLMLKLTQFAMSKRRDVGSFGRQLLGVIAMCLVPMIVFRGFIWFFNKTSQWALADTTNKILLSQINSEIGASITPAVTSAEETLENTWYDPSFGEVEPFTPFVEDFDADDEYVYKGAAFTQLIEYVYGNEPVFSDAYLNDMISKLEYNDSYNTWYQGQEFDAVHSVYYRESLFYFYYDYVRSEYLRYCLDNCKDPKYTFCATLMQNMQTLVDSEDANKSEKIENVESAYKALATTGVSSMLQDVDFIYGETADAELSYRYGTAQARDLVGLFYVFGGRGADGSCEGSIANAEDVVGAIQHSDYFKLFSESEVLRKDDSMIADLWIDQSCVQNYLSGSAVRGPVNGQYPVLTSRRDLFNSNLNSMAASVTCGDYYRALTPLENKLCDLSTRIYNKSVRMLSYLPEQTKEDAAIIAIALIATVETHKLIGVEPTQPNMATIDLDAISRAAFVHDLDAVSKSSNALYGMIAQGDSIGKVATVVVFEFIICIASIIRILLVIYITGATFVIFGLRMMHKAPRTADVAYGIVGNLAALLFLHAVTLALVVIAINWVAGVVSAIPNMIMDILMIAFCVLAVKLLYGMLKNIIRDAINLGGVKIRRFVHSVGRGVVQAFGKLTGKGDVSATSEEVSIIAEGLEYSEAAAHSRSAERIATDRRVSYILAEIEKIYSEEAEEQFN